MQLFRDDQKPIFAAHYNRSCFMFDHTLHTDPMFELDHLAELAGRLPPEAVFSSVGSVAVGTGWAGWVLGENPHRNVPDIIRGIASANAVIMLKSVDRNPEFGPAFRRVVMALAEQVGEQLMDDIDLGRATVLISSPRRVTSYHIDEATNYLMQVRGRKQFHVFDGRDRTLVTHEELEAFYGGDLNAVRYRPDRQDDANVFDMVPGIGVHVPVHSPHWVQNGEDVSVSLSVNYDLRSNRRIGAVYRVNGQLRRAGLNPPPPGASPWRDRLKAVALESARNARRLSRVLHR